MTTTTTKGCPFKPQRGYSTDDTRREWLFRHGISATEAKAIESLEANPDPDAPLYFWQLYSLIGREPIVSIIKNFYEHVYDDTENPWFRNAFADISGIGHHIQTQASYWIDAFGGGRLYHGGTFRLEFHHTHNASEVMNAKGASRWMYHMRRALNDHDFDDPRVKPCIVDFLKTKMQVYAEDHQWKFDESDFDFSEEKVEENSPPPLTLAEEKKTDEGAAMQDEK